MADDIAILKELDKLAEQELARAPDVTSLVSTDIPKAPSHDIPVEIESTVPERAELPSQVSSPPQAHLQEVSPAIPEQNIPEQSAGIKSPEIPAAPNGTSERQVPDINPEKTAGIKSPEIPAAPNGASERQVPDINPEKAIKPAAIPSAIQETVKTSLEIPAPDIPAQPNVKIPENYKAIEQPEKIGLEVPENLQLDKNKRKSRRAADLIAESTFLKETDKDMEKIPENPSMKSPLPPPPGFGQQKSPFPEGVNPRLTGYEGIGGLPGMTPVHPVDMSPKDQNAAQQSARIMKVWVEGGHMEVDIKNEIEVKAE